MAVDLRERVALERRLRYTSDRAAANAGDVSNTTWSRFVRGGELTDGIRQAVAKAFGWPADWPENPPPSPVADDGEPSRAQLLDVISQLTDHVTATLESHGELLQAIYAKLDGRPARSAGRAARSNRAT